MGASAAPSPSPAGWHGSRRTTRAARRPRAGLDPGGPNPPAWRGRGRTLSTRHGMGSRGIEVGQQLGLRSGWRRGLSGRTDRAPGLRCHGLGAQRADSSAAPGHHRAARRWRRRRARWRRGPAHRLGPTSSGIALVVHVGSIQRRPAARGSPARRSGCISCRTNEWRWRPVTPRRSFVAPQGPERRGCPVRRTGPDGSNGRCGRPRPRTPRTRGGWPPCDRARRGCEPSRIRA